MADELIAVDVKKNKTLVLGKMSEIKGNIQQASTALQDARDRVISAKEKYENVPFWKFWEKRKSKKDWENAKDELTFANSEVNIQILKMIGYTLELILFTFLTPMDLIQKTGQWVANGFKERDEKFIGLMRYLKNQNNKKNIFRGLFRIFIVLLVLSCLTFGIIKIVSAVKQKNNSEQAQTSSQEMNVSESQSVTDSQTIDEMQKKISELENILNELKQEEAEPLLNEPLAE